MVFISYFQNHKICLHRGEGVKKASNCAYVIYEWYLGEWCQRFSRVQRNLRVFENQTLDFSQSGGQDLKD